MLSDVSAHNIRLLSVRERKENNEWEIMWVLEGEQSLEAVEYGKQYVGLKERFPAKALSQKGRYEVYVSDVHRLKPGGHATANFTFNESGELRSI